MRVNVEQETNRLTFHLKPDELDGVPPISTVWFAFDRYVKVERDRLCLISYVLCADLVGNCFSVDDIAIPSHIASLLQHSFQGHELHFLNIDNVPRKIVNEPTCLGLMFENIESPIKEAATPAPIGWLLGRRTLLGLDIFESQDKKVLGISTNLALHASLAAAEPVLMIETATYLLCMDLLGPASVKLSAAEDGRRGLEAEWLLEVGGKVA